MTGTTSRAPQFKRDLLDAIKAKIPGVQVEYQWPGPNTRPEAIFLGNISGASSVPSMKSGRRSRDETYSVEVYVWVFRPDGTPLNGYDVEARAFELKAALDDVLADDPTFGGTVQWAGADTTFDTEWQAVDKGWGVQLLTRVDVNDRLY